MSIRKLSPELAKKAQEDLGENNDRLESDINALRSWIEEQNHLISRKDDQYMLSFLRRCNFNLEESKKRVDSFLTCKTNSPDIFKNRAVDEASLEILRARIVNITPKPLPNTGPRLIISQFCKFDPSKHTLKDVMRVRFMLFEILAFKDDVSSVCGVELIFDLKNCSLKQAWYLSPAVLKQASHYQENCVPLRIKNIHIINMKKELRSIVQFARNVFSASESEFQILIHENENDLYKYVPKEYLSSEYGGQNGSEEEFLQEWEKKFAQHAEYFEEESLLGTNEKLRKEGANPGLLSRLWFKS